eukprot:620303-Amorphochlora_amoeboformis.AAC.1
MPSIDKTSLNDLVDRLFEERRRDYNLAVLKHHDHYRKKLKEALLDVYGATNAQHGIEFSVMDFEMTCEMLQRGFPEKRAADVFKILDKNGNGLIDFEEFVSFYFERFKLHKASPGKLAPIDPIDKLVQDVVNSEHKVGFKISISDEEVHEIRKSVRTIDVKEQKAKGLKAQASRAKLWSMRNAVSNQSELSPSSGPSTPKSFEGKAGFGDFKFLSNTIETINDS